MDVAFMLGDGGAGLGLVAAHGHVEVFVVVGEGGVDADMLGAPHGVIQGQGELILGDLGVESGAAADFLDGNRHGFYLVLIRLCGDFR